MLYPWPFNDDLEQICGYPIAIWKHRADNVRGYGIGSRHHVAAENSRSRLQGLSQKPQPHRRAHAGDRIPDRLHLTQMAGRSLGAER